MSARSLVSFALLIAGCGGGVAPSGPPPERGTLEAGIVARVGEEVIAADTIGRIATTQGVDATAARELAIRDALYASEARARGLSEVSDIELRVNAALTRRLLHVLLDEAERAGPVTDAELEGVMSRRWIELDRPEGFRVVHAVVRLDEAADAAKRARAEAVARAIWKAEEPVAASARTIERPPSARPFDEVNDPVVTSFRGAADAVDKDGFEIKVEALPPVTADGRMIAPGAGKLVDAFVRAASSLEARGDMSPIVSTSFGLHVMVLLERTPPVTVPRDKRLALVRDEIMWSRAGASRMKILSDRRGGVLVERSAESLLALVSIER